MEGATIKLEISLHTPPKMARWSFARLEENDFKSFYIGVQDPGRSETRRINVVVGGKPNGRLSKGFQHTHHPVVSYEDIRIQKSIANVTHIPSRQGLSTKGSA